MALTSPPRRKSCRRHPRWTARLRLETLEGRFLPAPLTWPGLANPVPEVEPNDTLDQAQSLGTLSVASPAAVVGTTGNGTAGAADVDWYSFTLNGPANVHLATVGQQGGSSLVSVLTLYNNDPNDFSDPYDPLGYRELAQNDGATNGGDASISRLLGPGTYYVAVSGSGDTYFHPFIAGSGDPGSTGSYGLSITATDAGIAPTDGPAVLTADPAPGRTLSQAPFVIRLDLSTALDPTTVNAGQTVTLTYNPNGTFGDPNDQAVALASANFTAAANELQLIPAAPLAPGYYQVFLAGDSTLGPGNYLADPTGNPLGANALHPTGANYTTTFRINGINGVVGATGSDDTPATAQQLGDVTSAGLVRTTGAIGNDPDYNPASSNPNLSNPAAQVNMYHFQVSGSGQYALIAEAFAGRIGSPLDPGLSLFRLDPSTGQLQLVGVNDNTLNNTQATNGTVPLFTDAALFVGLSAGDYYLTVSGTGNLPDPSVGAAPGVNGVFDPNITDSGQGGFTTGPYILNLLVQPVPIPPQVVAVTSDSGSALAGATLTAPPTQLVVKFSEPVNLQQLAFQTFQTTSQPELASVYVLGSDGKQYHPRLVSYDPTTGLATFLMLDALPNGPSALHLSGAGSLGIQDFGGHPLTGNDPSGDYVVRFTVNGPPRGSNGNPLIWLDQEPNDTLPQAQNLGVLFPHELQSGVTLSRPTGTTSPTPGSDTADYYKFQILQTRDYIFALSGTNLPKGALPTIYDSTGKVLNMIPQGMGGGVRGSLDPGTYYVKVGGWAAGQGANVSYNLRISLGYSTEDPVPLTVGPAPAYRLSLASNPPPPPPAPGGSGGSGGSTSGTGGSSGGTTGTGGGGQGTGTGGGSGSGGTTGGGGPTAPSPGLVPPLPPPPAPPSTPPAPPLQLALPPVLTGPVVNPPAVIIVSQNPGGEAPVAVTLPPDTLALLSAVPVGGVRGPALSNVLAAPDQVVLRRLELSPTERQLRVLALNQPLLAHAPLADTDLPSGQDGPGLPSDILGKVIKHSVTPLENLWRQVLDDFFGRGVPVWHSGVWPKGLAESLLEASAPLEDSTAAEDTAGEDDAEAAVPLSALGAELPSTAVDWAWAAALPAVGLLVGMDSRQRRARGPGLGRSHEDSRRGP